MQAKDEVLAELMADRIALKKSWGALTKVLVPHDVRDQVVDVYREIGWQWATEHGRSIDDGPLEEVNIKAGMRLEVRRPSKKSPPLDSTPRYFEI